MRIKRNKGDGINFVDVENGIAVEDRDGNIYIKISNHDVVNVLDLETNFLCYMDPKEIAYPYKKAYISLEN